MMKKTGNLFESHISHYPFNHLEALSHFKEIANNKARLLLHENFFFLFSDYYKLYDSTMNLIFKHDNLIPVKIKIYLAIMAVSSISSMYLLQHLEQEFLLAGGDIDWLINGLNSFTISTKLKMIAKFNNILAHQLWKLKVQDIKVI